MLIVRCSRCGAILFYATKHRFVLVNPYKKLCDLAKRITELKNRGHSITSIAKVLGIDVYTVWKILDKGIDRICSEEYETRGTLEPREVVENLEKKCPYCGAELSIEPKMVSIDGKTIAF